jgi:Protein of unknown function (DUF2997)
MKKVIAKIDKKTGKLTLSTEGFSGEACLAATKKLREGLGIDAEPEKLPEFFQEEVKDEQQQGT